jgi:hypothetical protein
LGKGHREYEKGLIKTKKDEKIGANKTSVGGRGGGGTVKSEQWGEEQIQEKNELAAAGLETFCYE